MNCQESTFLEYVVPFYLVGAGKTCLIKRYLYKEEEGIYLNKSSRNLEKITWCFAKKHEWFTEIFVARNNFIKHLYACIFEWEGGGVSMKQDPTIGMDLFSKTIQVNE